MENKYQPENPYPETIYDDASGIAIPNEAHRAWQEGFEAGSANIKEVVYQQVLQDMRDKLLDWWRWYQSQKDLLGKAKEDGI